MRQGPTLSMTRARTGSTRFRCRIEDRKSLRSGMTRIYRFPFGGVLLEISADLSHVGDEEPFGDHPLVPRRPQHGRGVYGREHGRRQIGFLGHTARLHDTERAAEQ